MLRPAQCDDLMLDPPLTLELLSNEFCTFMQAEYGRGMIKYTWRVYCIGSQQTIYMGHLNHHLILTIQDN